MYNVSQLLPELVARERLHRRQRAEAERRERVFNDKVRTIGIDKEALDAQMIEKKKEEDAAERERKAYDAEMLHNSRVLTLLHRRQQKERRAMEKAVVSYQHERQQPRSRREQGPDDPKHGSGPGDGQMMLQGLTGEDLQCKIRQQKQKDQLRQWLTQQQTEQTAQRDQQKMEDQLYDQGRAEMDNKALELQSAEVQTRAAAAVATKEHNLAMMEEQKQQRRREGLTEASWSRAGVPGLRSERRASPERLQQMVQFQKRQMEEKQRKEAEVKQEEEGHERARLDSARTALLAERQQARLSKQLRRDLDRSNVKLAQEQRQRRPVIERGCVEDSFYAQFNTCSR